MTEGEYMYLKSLEEQINKIAVRVCEKPLTGNYKTDIRRVRTITKTCISIEKHFKNVLEADDYKLNYDKINTNDSIDDNIRILTKQQALFKLPVKTRYRLGVVINMKKNRSILNDYIELYKTLKLQKRT